jgi:hypothetical protein
VASGAAVKSLGLKPPSCRARAVCKAPFPTPTAVVTV